MEIYQAKNIEQLNSTLMKQNDYLRQVMKNNLRPNCIIKFVTNQIKVNDSPSLLLLKQLGLTLREIEVFNTDIFSSGSASLVVEYTQLLKDCEKLVDSFSHQSEETPAAEVAGVDQKYLSDFQERMDNFIVKALKQTQKHIVVSQYDISLDECTAILSSVENSANTIIQFIDNLESNTIWSTLLRYKEIPTIYIMSKINRSEEILNQFTKQLEYNQEIPATLLIQKIPNKQFHSSFQLNNYFDCDLSTIINARSQAHKQLSFLPYKSIEYFKKNLNLSLDLDECNLGQLQNRLLSYKHRLNQLVNTRFLTNQTTKFFLNDFQEFVSECFRQNNDQPQELSTKILRYFSSQVSRLNRLLTSQEESINCFKELIELVILCQMVYDDQQNQSIKMESTKTLVYSGMTISLEDFNNFVKPSNEIAFPAFALFHQYQITAEKDFAQHKSSEQIDLIITCSYERSNYCNNLFKCINNEQQKRLEFISLPFKKIEILNVEKVYSDCYKIHIQ